jgi:transglutaminase-like putative cysteine protease
MGTAAASLRLPVTALVATVLASISLGATFLTGTWVLPAVTTAALAVAGAEAARRLGVARLTVPVVGLLVLLEVLVLRYASEEALLRVVPTPDALRRLGDLVALGREDIAQFAAPIGVSPGVEVIAVGGVALVAVAVDALAVTWRRAALAGLPLIALYTVPTAVAPDGVSWVAFAIGGAGYLALLLAESRERVSRWGRPMTYSRPRANWRPEVETAPLAQVGRRVGAAALGLALVVPAVLPDIDAGTFGFGGAGFGRGGGGNTVKVINPILDIGRDLRAASDDPVLRYEGEPTYLRLVGLDVFDGETWRPSRLQVPDENTVSDGLVDPPGLSPAVERTTRRYSIAVGELDQTWLPLPYPAERVDIDGRWLYDSETFNVFGVNTKTRGLGYEVRSLSVEPTAQQLRSAPTAPESLSTYLELPPDVPDRVIRTARQVTADADSAYEQAVRLQRFFRDPDRFTYSTTVSDRVGDANGSEAIAAFLADGRGYCVQFASSMAVMARQLGIPARVAVGFIQGTPDGQGGMVVRLNDAHSWPELYFEGVGWVAFEPTPADRTGAAPAYTQEQGDGPEGGAEDPAAGPDGGADTPGNPRQQDGPSGNIRPDLLEDFGTGAAAESGGWRPPLVPSLLLGAALLLLLVPALTRVIVRRRRWRRSGPAQDRVAAAWSELRDTLVDFGRPWLPSDPPRRGVARLASELTLDGAAAESLRRLGAACERARYAPDPGEVGDLRPDVEVVRAALAESSSRPTRLRARWLPRSTRAVATRIGDRVADALDALDALSARLSSRLSGRRAG